MNLYTDEFIENLPQNPKLALHSICVKFLQTSQGALDVALEFFALAEVYISVNQLNLKMPKLSTNRKEKADAIYQFAVMLNNDLEKYVELNQDQLILDKLRKKFALRITGGFVYKFSDGDLSRLKVLFGETRELLNSSEHFDEAYRTRLAKRIDKLNLRLCKRSTDLDPYWGLVGDAGVIAGKAGKYARLLVDKITQITNIVWRTQARAEELSSSCCPPNLITTMDRKKESK